MLLQNFYTILDQRIIEDNSIVFVIKLNSDHSIFNGHFPNHPVTPGVGMLQIMKELSEAFLQTNLQMQRLSNVKFLKLVNPNENSSLIYHLHFQKGNKIYKVKNNTTFEDGTTVFKCDTVFLQQ